MTVLYIGPCGDFFTAHCEQFDHTQFLTCLFLFYASESRIYTPPFWVSFGVPVRTAFNWSNCSFWNPETEPWGSPLPLSFEVRIYSPSPTLQFGLRTGVPRGWFFRSKTWGSPLVCELGTQSQTSFPNPLPKPTPQLLRVREGEGCEEGQKGVVPGGGPTDLSSSS